ncbi:acyl-ACP desaturase (plasmid) [Rhodococcus pyridinivorans]|jgi:acyl-[acyl-carrier-protein] desaturase|nr:MULTISPECIES: acyl-ACP desaturase [Rhodococcus]QXU56529.1 acyl-ACP desaturase [Rhodococcus sp. LW-XY12]MCT7294071.1 acyl-ACP desaturase [Rhodococcus sp. PAE-6]UQB75774.1 acyl-ACP desaturase [Rhodococcus ruber]UVT27696.1 acyl-ACP desaturase [Rhodococcus pyridinivorans]WML66439.1 acyl-ACP desaturase [Rhodococcus sp. AH-ZY2]
MHSDIGQFTVLRELRPTIEENLARHRVESVQWVPADFVRAEMYWGSRPSPLTETAKAALVTNLLVEQNIPLYRRDAGATEIGAWPSWLTDWSSERRRHSVALTDYLVATRSVDPVALGRARAQCMTVGFDAPMNGAHLLRSLVQVVLDESVSTISHRNTADQCHDPVADRLLGRIVADQELHVRFFANLVSAALTVAPGLTVTAITEVVMNFQLPGTNLPGFARSAMLIARDGIYDLARHLDEVLRPMLAQWRIFERTDLGAGARSRDQLADYLDHLDAQAATIERSSVRTREYANALRAS